MALSSTVAARPTMGEATPWLGVLTRAATADALRAALRQRQPAFDPASLSRLAILGAAGEGQRLAALCRAQGIDIAAVVDDNASVQGDLVAGAAVRPSSALDELPRETPIVIASHRVQRAYERLRGLGFANVAPFAVLQALDASRFPPHMFYDGWLEDLATNRAQYARVAGLFADDASRRVLDAVLGFRQTLDPMVLAPVVEWDLYGPGDLLQYGADEVYVDGGAFDGDTIRLFIERVRGRFNRVIAFEPDPRTFLRLKANFAAEPRVEPINAGLHRRKSVLHFHADSSRGAIFTDQGAEKIDVVALDDVLDGGRVSYIKLNIEGAEIEALNGAATAIRRWAPKLAISVYHRPSDLWQIPDVVLGLRADYDLYLRQHDGGVIETVLYALPTAKR